MSEIKYVDSVALKTFWELAKTEITNMAKQQIIDLVYPIGSIYISFEETDPSILFGGSWQKIEDKFLLAADSEHKVNTTGNGVLSTTNIPKFTGTIGSGTGAQDGTTRYGAFRGSGSGLTSGVFTPFNQATNYYAGGSASPSGAWQSVKFEIGQSNPDPVYPPYIAVHMWRRVEDSGADNEPSAFILDESLLDDNMKYLE